MKPLLLLILVLPFLSFTTFYDTEKYKQQLVLETGGCAVSTGLCPLVWNVEKYYASYEQGSEEYWRSYCNSTADYPEELLKFKCT